MKISDPTEKEIEEALEWADSESVLANSKENGFHKDLLVLATAYRALLARCLKHEGHEHCVTPCDSIRIQDSNHSAWLGMKDRAEKAESSMRKQGKSTAYNCHKCGSEHTPNNMISYCGSCFYRLEKELESMPQKKWDEAVLRELGVQKLHAEELEIKNAALKAQLEAAGKVVKAAKDCVRVIRANGEDGLICRHEVGSDYGCETIWLEKALTAYDAQGNVKS